MSVLDVRRVRPSRMPIPTPLEFDLRSLRDEMARVGIDRLDIDELRDLRLLEIR